MKVDITFKDCTQEELLKILSVIDVKRVQVKAEQSKTGEPEQSKPSEQANAPEHFANEDPELVKALKDMNLKDPAGKPANALIKSLGFKSLREIVVPSEAYDELRQKAGVA